MVLARTGQIERSYGVYFKGILFSKGQSQLKYSLDGMVRFQHCFTQLGPPIKFESDQILTLSTW